MRLTGSLKNNNSEKSTWKDKTKLEKKGKVFIFYLSMDVSSNWNDVNEHEADRGGLWLGMGRSLGWRQHLG